MLILSAFARLVHLGVSCFTMLNLCWAERNVIHRYYCQGFPLPDNNLNVACEFLTVTEGRLQMGGTTMTMLFWVLAVLLLAVLVLVIPSLAGQPALF